MIGKKHNLNGKIIFACCDKDLINTKIMHDEVVIEIRDDFFGTTKINEKELIDAIENCDSANIFGKKVCNLLVKNKLISENHIILINNVPHTQIYKL